MIDRNNKISNHDDINIININNQIKSKIKSANLESLQALTIHGIPHLIRTKFLLIKIIWIILLLASTCLSIYFIIQTLNEFFDYNVTTEVRLKEEVEFVFPAVTFCNKNKFSTNYSLSHLESTLENFKINYTMRHLNEITRLEMKLLFRFYPANFLFEDLNIEQRKNMTQSLNEMFIFGSYDYYILNQEHFEWIYNRKYGNCYTFNMNQAFKSKKIWK
jgi:acid-sensing ion channel 5